MATFNSPDLGTKPRHMGGYGNLAGVWGTVTPTAGALADVYIPVVIPAGLEVWDVDILFDDLDTGATTFAVKIGYAPVNAADGPVAVDDYFSAASTFLSGAAGRKQCVFQPIKFEKPVYLTLIVTVAATTFAAGKVTALIKGDGLGIK